MSRDVGTPLMQQYRDIKAQHQNAILFFRMGDFYEMFYEDAEVASRVLGLTLTSRNNGGAAHVPLAGVPVKALNEYLRRLVSQGFRVAICEQVEDPKLAKGVVRREVVETITPGAAFADDLLDGARNNFLCAVSFGADATGIAAADLSTGELRLTLTPAADTKAALARLSPNEILVAKGEPHQNGLAVAAFREENALVTEREAWEFDPTLAADELGRQFRGASLEQLGLTAGDSLVVGATGALLRYLRELQPSGVPHLTRPLVERPGSAMPLDEMTRRNLELVESLRGGETAGTLLDVLDRTMTPMGARLLRHWLLTPLTDRAAIETRLSAVESLARDPLARAALRTALDGVRDVERLGSKTAAGRATPRELAALGASLSRLPAVEEAAQRASVGKAVGAFLGRWDPCVDLAIDIARTLVDRPPMLIGEEETVREGIDAELDEMRELQRGGKDAIARIQATERERTGIPSLKVGYNKIFGYFISITNANRHLVPPNYQRRQTLAGEERYVTPELKEYEEKVLNASERIETRERMIFESLRVRVGACILRLQGAASVLAQLDVLATFADVAER